MSRFRIELQRNGIIIAQRSGKNTVTTEGLEHVVDMVLQRSGGAAAGPSPTGPRAWRVGVFTSGSITVSSKAGTPGVTEFSDYTVDNFGTDTVNRSLITAGFTPVVTDGNAGIIESTSIQGGGNEGALTITSAATLTGAFWITSAIKGDTSGFLWGGASFDTPLDVKSGDKVTIFYELNATNKDQDFTSTFRMSIEIDKVEIFEALTAVLIKTININTVHRVVFNAGLREFLNVGFLLDPTTIQGTARMGGRILSDGGTAGPAPNPPLVLAPRIGFTNTNISDLTTGGAIGGFGLQEPRDRVVITTVSPQIIWGFDTPSTSLRFFWNASRNISFGEARGVILRHAYETAGTAFQIAAWHWPASENPIWSGLGERIETFGRLILEPL